MKQAAKNMRTAWIITIINLVFLELILALTTLILIDNVVRLEHNNSIRAQNGAIWFFYYILIWVDPLCRLTIRNYCRLPFSYTLPSYFLTTVFIPTIILENNQNFATIGALISVLFIIFLPVFNIYYLIRAKRESAFEPVPPDNAQQ